MIEKCWGGVARNGCGHPGHKVNGYIFKKAKSYFNSYWVAMVKYGCVLLGHRILKSAIPQLKNKSMNWADFLHAGSDGIIFG